MILLTPRDARRTLRGMGGHRIAMVGGGAWSLFRFGLVALLTLRLVTGDPLFHLNLLWIGAPALLMGALFGGSAFVAGSQRYYLPLLRIGAALTVVADAAVVISRSYLGPEQRIGAGGDPLARLIFIIVYGVAAVDLLIFAALISYRPMYRETHDDDTSQPEYSETRLEDE